MLQQYAPKYSPCPLLFLLSSWPETFTQLFCQFFRRGNDQFRLQQLLQEIIVVTVVGIQVLPGNDLDECAKAPVIFFFFFLIERVIVIEMTKSLVMGENF